MENIYTFKPQRNSPWKCKLFGHKQGLVFIPAYGEEPCWFHRLMQRLILGHRWTKEVS